MTGKFRVSVEEIVVVEKIMLYKCVGHISVKLKRAPSRLSSQYNVNVVSVIRLVSTPLRASD